MTTGCHAMSHRLRLVVDGEVRGAGHELELQAGGRPPGNRMAFLGISLSSAPNSTSVGTRSRRPQQLPRMIVINSGRMSCRYSADAARARAGSRSTARYAATSSSRDSKRRLDALRS
jgi:hypothetical protein